MFPTLLWRSVSALTLPTTDFPIIYIHILLCTSRNSAYISELITHDCFNVCDISILFCAYPRKERRHACENMNYSHERL